MFPPFTDFAALLGINLALCAGCLCLLSPGGAARLWTKWLAALLFVALWMPVGASQLPLVAYVRGVSSDLSVTLLLLACLALRRRLFGYPALDQREHTVLLALVAVAALFLYPLALGWGDWDAYRLGWGAPGMLAALLLLSLVCWLRGLRLAPLITAAALLAWTAGWLESGNLWDYLIDPWLAMAAIAHCLTAVILKLTRRRESTVPGSA